MTITDDTANDTFRAWAESYNNYALESDGAAAVRVRLAGQYEHDISMILQTATADSATVGQDYEHYSRVVRFAPYETEKTIHIDIMDDRKREAPEVFYTRLSLQIADVRLSDDDRQTAIWIGDDDHQKAIQSTTADYGDDLRKRHFQVAEGATDSYHVWLTRRPTEPVTVRLNPYSGDPDLTITSDTSHTFDAGNWFEPYIVTIRAGQDDDSVDGYVYIRQEVETEDPFFRDHSPGYVVANEMDDDPGDEPTVIESETHGGVNNGITASVAYAPYRHKGSPFPDQVRVLRSRPRRLHEDAGRSADRHQRAGAPRLPDEAGRPPLDLRDRGLRLGEPGDHHAGGKPRLRRGGSGLRQGRPKAGQHPDPHHAGAGMVEPTTYPHMVARKKR